MFREEDDFAIINYFNERVENMKSEKNLMIPIKMVAVQGEAKKLGINNTPIYCQIEGLDVDENEGSLISNGDYVFYVDEISNSGFVKLYLFGAGPDEWIARDEFKKEFSILC